MFTWIQTTFKKHLPVFIVLLLLLLIIPFVFTIGAMPGLGFAERKTRKLEIFGKPFTTEAQRNAFFEGASLSVFLTTGRPALDGNQLQFYAFRRAAALQYADKLGIPEPTEENLAEFIKTLPAFQGPDGSYSREAYTRFRDNIAANPQADVSLINRVLRDDWRVAQVERILGGPGFVTDDEIRQVLIRNHTRWTVERATLDLSGITDPTEPTEEEIQQWFETNKIRYRLPERVRVDYALFRASEYAVKVQLTDDEISAYFEQNKSRYRQPAPEVAEGETPPPPVEPTLEEVRDRVVADLTRIRARTLAAEAAADFAYDLFDRGLKPGTIEFDNELAARGIRLQAAPPVAAGGVVPALGWTPQITSAIAKLDEDRPVSDPLQAGDNIYVAIFRERIPAADATLAEVRDRVIADLKAHRNRQAITARGKEIREKLLAALAEGKTFAEAAQAEGLEVKRWENFTFSELPQDIDYGVLSRLEELAPGEISPMSVQGTTGVFVHVVAREEPPIDPASEEYIATRENLMRQGSALTAQGVLAELVQRELVAAGLAEETPVE